MASCKYCGQEFTKTHNRQMYCSPECSKKAKRDQDRNHWHKWYHKNKKNLPEKVRWGYGSGTLGPHRYDDHEKELTVIEKEMKRLRLI